MRPSAGAGRWCSARSASAETAYVAASIANAVPSPNRTRIGPPSAAPVRFPTCHVISASPLAAVSCSGRITSWSSAVIDGQKTLWPRPTRNVST